MGICALFYIFISAITCAKFGVAVGKASAQLEGVSLPWVYVHCCIYICHYMCQVWCSSIQCIYAQFEGGSSAMGICALCYI